VFAIAWVIAPVGWLIVEASGVLLTPVVLVALLAVLLRRILRGTPETDAVKSG
jgi:branched-subunit amino acid permease